MREYGGGMDDQQLDAWVATDYGEIRYLEGVGNDNDGRALVIPQRIIACMKSMPASLGSTRLPHRLRRGAPHDGANG